MMPSPSLAGLSILVVEGDNREASDLRLSLIKLGAHVHVVANARTGLMVASRKRIHGAILDRIVSQSSALPLSTHLAMSAVPFMYFEASRGSEADEAARRIADLISAVADRELPERRRPILGSGEDRHISI